jgi:hypothetical protein
MAPSPAAYEEFGMEVENLLQFLIVKFTDGEGHHPLEIESALREAIGSLELLSSTLRQASHTGTG